MGTFAARILLELDGNTHTTYAYDLANRLTTLTDDASQSYTYGDDIADRLISKALPNGITTTYDYDGMSRLTRLKDATVGSTLLDRQYSYNTANQISAITEPSRTRTFGYDNINRLTSATDSLLGSESYAVDSLGNRTSSHLSASYTTAPFNRTTNATGITQTFDSNGNTATRTQSGANWTYSWDRENRLTQASSSGATVDYIYDALGRRVRRTEVSTDTKFTHDGQDVILDDVASTLTKYQNGPGIDNKLSVKQGTTTNYFLADHLGSTDALTDGTGTVITSNSYDSFGNPTNSGFPTRYQFTGREFDPTIGLQFSRARFYDPQLGRFVSEDPIGFAGGDVNLYGYVKNRPIKHRDPRGLDDADREWENQMNPPAPSGNWWGGRHNESGDNQDFEPHTFCPRPSGPPHIPVLSETGLVPNGCIELGWRAEGRNFPNGAPDGSTDIYGGAYRHCVATCHLMRRYGPLGGIARGIWDYVHESSGSENDQADRQGEDKGEAVAVGCSSCEEGCLDYYPAR